MMQNTSVNPAASRNSSRPNCNPFRICSTTSSMDALGRFPVESYHHHASNGLMVRDARRGRAPHHEGLEDLILRSIANGSRECAPDDRLRDASRRMKPPDREML